MPLKTSPIRLAICVTIFASAIGFLGARTQGPLNRPTTHGDELFYLDLARSLAAGKGYTATLTPWPGLAHLGRLPLWPALLAPELWLFEAYVGPNVVLRGTATILQGICCGLLVLLTYRVWRDELAAVLAGVLLATYVPALGLMEIGLSEHAFLVMGLAGFLLLFADRWKQVVGAGLLGLSVLSRGNFVLLPLMMALVGIVRRRGSVKYWKRYTLLAVVFLIPASLWILRNYRVSGVFPLLSALDGEAFYGANNSMLRVYVYNWGFYMYPDGIPGERPKKELAKVMSEAELNHYYKQKGMAYIRKNWFVYPFLIMGKLIRGFVPIPMNPTAILYIGSLARWLLYGGFVLAIRRGVLQNELYATILGATFLVTLATTIIYYGTFRFTFCLEVFFMPCVGVLLARQWRKCHRSEAMVSTEREGV